MILLDLKKNLCEGNCDIDIVYYLEWERGTQMQKHGENQKVFFDRRLNYVTFGEPPP